MTYFTILRPGSKGGPCVGHCRHFSCRDMFDQADAFCFICHKSFGFNVRLTYIFQNTTLPPTTVHFECVNGVTSPTLKLTAKSRDQNVYAQFRQPKFTE